MSQPNPSQARKRHEDLVKDLEVEANNLGIVTTESESRPGLPLSKLRRSRKSMQDDPTGIFSLVERDGVLEWHEGPGGRTMGPRRRRRAGLPGSAANETVVTRFRFEKLAPNEIWGALKKMDDRLTPNQGLRSWEDGWKTQPDIAKAGRVLVFIHGTFSNNDHVFEELNSTESGHRFLRQAAKHYDQILAFDHPTLSLSPVLNAFDLHQLMIDSSAQMDVIAHSRGGLVARWWLEGFRNGSSNHSKAVLVGSPLSGTSLASPARMRQVMSLLTNIGEVLKLAGASATTILPFTVIPLGLLKVVTSITSLTAKLPLFDAAIAMIPGLACQSRVGNNAELLRLRARRKSQPVYYAIGSNFEPGDVGWAFWKRFTKQRLLDAGADCIFQGANDLVVDVDSIFDVSDQPLPAARKLDFGTTDKVHHCSYFRDPSTVQSLTRWLLEQKD